MEIYVKNDFHIFFFFFGLQLWFYHLHWLPVSQLQTQQLMMSQISSHIKLLFSASEMTYIVSSGALNSTHSLTRLADDF